MRLRRSSSEPDRLTNFDMEQTLPAKRRCKNLLCNRRRFERKEEIGFFTESKNYMKIKPCRDKRCNFMIKQTYGCFELLGRPNKIKNYDFGRFNTKSVVINKSEPQFRKETSKKQDKEAIKKGITTADDIRNLVSTLIGENKRLRDLLNEKDHQIKQLDKLIAVYKKKESNYQNALQTLSKEALVDPLTQIANRRGLNQAFEVQRKLLGESSGMALGILDIDNFKLLNDKFGHHVGDEALKFTVKNLKEELPVGSTLARYGGEEFVVIFPNTTVLEAQKMLARIQLVKSSSLFNSGNDNLLVTFSAGVTQYRANESMEEALQRADKGLYEAKNTGKNRTCVV